jgi:hypothetical protein
MKPFRRRLAARLVSRIGVDLFPNPVFAEIFRRVDIQPATLCHAAAIARIEIDQRRLGDRLIEYGYVFLRGPHHKSVSIGPAQLRFALLEQPCIGCVCQQDRYRPSLTHCFSTRHHAAVLIGHVAALSARLDSLVKIFNAYHKGVDAADLSLDTVYSEVAWRLSDGYSEWMSTNDPLWTSNLTNKARNTNGTTP